MKILVVNYEKSRRHFFLPEFILDFLRLDTLGELACPIKRPFTILDERVILRSKLVSDVASTVTIDIVSSSSPTAGIEKPGRECVLSKVTCAVTYYIVL